ncbi:arginine deiminase family protein [Thermodesulfobacteriota bacterium]
MNKLHPKKVLLIEDDHGWINDFKEWFKLSQCLIDGDGSSFQQILQDSCDIDLVLIDFDLGADRPTGDIILRKIRDLNPNMCIGLFSGIQHHGFSAADTQFSDFYSNKETFLDRTEAFKDVIHHWSSFMKDRCSPNISTEWGHLKTVLVHTPGTELQYVDVEDSNYLMEERPDVERAAEEHKNFIATLRKTSQSTVLEIRDLLEDVFKMYDQEKDRELLLAKILFDDDEFSFYQMLRKVSMDYPHLCTQAIEDVKHLEPKEVVQFIYEGWNSANWSRYQNAFKNKHVAFLLEMNNAYFTRDPGFTLDGLFVTSNMTKKIRKREARVLDLVLRNHPWLKGTTLSSFARRGGSHRIEGGDVIAIGPKQLAVGWSERTSLSTIKALASDLIIEHDYEEVFAIPIPERRAFMHLDTVFSLVGGQTALVYPEAIEAQVGFFSITRAPTGSEDGIEIKANEHSFLKYLEQKRGMRIIQTAGGHVGSAVVEQFTDATNCFAIGDGKVVSYKGNKKTNEALSKAGIEVITVEGYELVKGRGGPRCMTMPISRE